MFLIFLYLSLSSFLRVIPSSLKNTLFFSTWNAKWLGILNILTVGWFSLNNFLASFCWRTTNYHKLDGLRPYPLISTQSVGCKFSGLFAQHITGEIRLPSWGPVRRLTQVASTVEFLWPWNWSPIWLLLLTTDPSQPEAPTFLLRGPSTFKPAAMCYFPWHFLFCHQWSKLCLWRLLALAQDHLHGLPFH